MFVAFRRGFAKVQEFVRCKILKCKNGQTEKRNYNGDSMDTIRIISRFPHSVELRHDPQALNAEDTSVP